MPKNFEGSLKYNPTDEGTLSCPDGCSDSFPSFSAMYDHCLIGRHTYQLQKMSTFDSVKLRWYDTCMNLSEGMANIQRVNESRDEEIPEVNVPKGWALKRDKKQVRFNDKVKSYLRTIFEEGEKSGNKMNATAVAKSMRVIRENGQKKFHSQEYLEPSQIASFFSRIAAQKKMAGSSTSEDDIDSAIALIEKLEAIEEVTSLLE